MDESTARSRAAELLEQSSDLTREAADALAAGDLAAAEALEVRADELRRQARMTIARIVRRSRSVGGGRLTAREQAITALAEMGVPSPPREIAEFHEARFSSGLDARALASVRRDEAAAWDRDPSSRAAFLVPALDIRFFRPVRGPLTLSSWELEQRLLGASSPRVDHLRLTVRLAELAERLEGEPGQALTVMAARYAQTVPGASDAGHDAEPRRIADAAHRELEILAPQDDEERASAAARAREQLEEAELMWGRDADGHGLKVVGR
ncbi:MAG: hypothetical protein ACRDK0_04250 [Solirubrobacteraceae bacterium]